MVLPHRGFSAHIVGACGVKIMLLLTCLGDCPSFAFIGEIDRAF